MQVPARTEIMSVIVGLNFWFVVIYFMVEATF